MAGGEETAEEVVACGREARAQADQPRRRAAHGVEAPGPHAAAEIQSGLRQSLRHSAGRSRSGQQWRDAQVGRRALLQRFEQRHAGAPALAVASKRGDRLRDEPARRSAIHPKPAAAARPLEHDLVDGEDAAVARHEPKRREVLRRGEADAARQVVGLRAEQGQKIAVRRAEVQGGVKDAVNAHRKFAARDVRSQRRGPPDSVSHRSHGRSREPP